MTDSPTKQISGHEWDASPHYNRQPWKPTICCECGWRCESLASSVECSKQHAAHLTSVARAAQPVHSLVREIVRDAANRVSERMDNDGYLIDSIMDEFEPILMRLYTTTPAMPTPESQTKGAPMNYPGTRKAEKICGLHGEKFVRESHGGVEYWSCPSCERERCTPEDSHSDDEIEEDMPENDMAPS